MCQLTAQVMVAHMLFELKAPMLQTCRSCVTGSIVLACFGGGLCDLPFFQPVQANAVNDAFRSLRGLPLFETATGLVIFQNIHFLVQSGEIDLALITDPKTGRVSDELMCLHLKTTYKQLVLDKCSPGFADASPENVLACSQMDFLNWGKRPWK